MKSSRSTLALLILLALHSAHADVLELKNGSVLNGKYVGGTANTVRFETATGVQVLETSQLIVLTFTPAPPTGTPTPAPAPTSAAPAAAPKATATTTAAPAAATINVPAGTTLLVRLVDPVTSNDPKGKRFTTTLETDLLANGTVVAKAGTKVFGRVQSAEQARRYAGQSKIDIRLAEISIGSTLVPIVTSGHTDAGERSGRKVARGAAAGAAIGGIADGSEGAGKGAAIGAVASGARRGESVSLSPGSLLEFRLEQPVSIQPAP